MIRTLTFEDEESFVKFLELHRRGTGRIVITFVEYPKIVVDIDEHEKTPNHLVSVLGSLRAMK
jgi:hypothetical protein